VVSSTILAAGHDTDHSIIFNFGHELHIMAQNDLKVWICESASDMPLNYIFILKETHPSGSLNCVLNGSITAFGTFSTVNNTS